MASLKIGTVYGYLRNVIGQGRKDLAASRKTARAAYQTIQAYRASPEGSIHGLAREALGIEDPHLEEAKIMAISNYLKSRLWPRLPKIILVTGTILRDLSSDLENPIVIPYDEVPHMPHFADRKGQQRKLVIGNIGDKAVAFLDRFHPYEGVTPREAVRLIRALITFHARYFIVINSAGGANPDIKVGDLVIIKDGINLMGNSPLVGPNLGDLGERCPRVGHVFKEDGLGGITEMVARGRGIPVKTGVYGAVLGPELGTEAALDMWHRLGIDIVGMSTMPEIIAVAHAQNFEKIKVLGISLVTDSRTEDFDILDRSMLLAGEEVRKLRQRSVENLERLVVGTIEYLSLPSKRKEMKPKEVYAIRDGTLSQLISLSNLMKVYNGDPKAVSPEFFTEITQQKDTGLGGPHRWDVSMHSIKTVEKMLDLLSFGFIEDKETRAKYIERFSMKVGHLSVADLLVLAALFHDTGKKKSMERKGRMKRHVEFGLEILRENRILERFGLTPGQKEFVLDLVGLHHKKPHELSEKESEEIKGKGNNFLEALSLLTLADAFAVQGSNVPVIEVFLKEIVFV